MKNIKKLNDVKVLDKNTLKNVKGGWIPIEGEVCSPGYKRCEWYGPCVPDHFGCY